MNKIEKLVYDALKRHPQIKLFVRDMYQNVMDLIPDKPNFTAGDTQVFEGFFWGFHDVSPISSDERHMLGCKLNIPLRMPQLGEPLTIGYWDLSRKEALGRRTLATNGTQEGGTRNENSQFNEVATSYAWAYHKGCRLQWLGDSNDTFIFNTCRDNRLCAEIHRIPSRSEECGVRSEITYPIDTVSHNGHPCLRL